MIELYNYVPNVEARVSIECAEEFIDDGKTTIEYFVQWMIDEGYNMDVFS